MEDAKKKTTVDLSTWLTPKEAAAELDVHERTVIRMCITRKLRFTRKASAGLKEPRFKICPDSVQKIKDQRRR